MRGKDLLDEENLLEISSRLGREVEDDGWDDTMDLSKDEEELLRRKSTEANSGEWARWITRLPCSQCVDIVYVVTDATPFSIGWVEMREGGVRRHGRQEWLGKEDQVIMEMRGFVVGVREVTEGRKQLRVVGGVDAEIVRRVVEKGYSRSHRLREQLRELRALVLERNLRIEVVRVPGTDNVADAVSRKKEIEDDKAKISWKCLKA